MNGVKIGYALCGSFCTLDKSIEQMKILKNMGADLFPIFSPIVYTTDTRFGKAVDMIKIAEEICQKPVMHTIPAVEPIGPKGLLDLLIIAPCTGNTLGKLACGITDTSVTMAAKAHLRNERPLLIAPSTNDGLSASGKNIGLLLNTKNIYFVPFAQDAPNSKHTSLVAIFDQIPKAAEDALKGIQLQPIL